MHIVQQHKKQSSSAKPSILQRGKAVRLSKTIPDRPVFFSHSIQLNGGGGSAFAFPIQTKLRIGQPGDRYEQEADHIADQVVQRLENPASAATVASPVPQPGIGSVQKKCKDCGQEKPEENQLQTKPLVATITPLIQRQSNDKEAEEEPKSEAPTPNEEVRAKPLTSKMTPLVQRQSDDDTESEKEEEPTTSTTQPEEDVQTKPAGDGLLQRQEASPEEEPEQEDEDVQAKRDGQDGLTASSALASRLQAAKGGGRPLSAPIRAQMEGAFGADFSGVRIHTNETAERMNRGLQAQAFTHGRDVYFGAGKFQPGTTEGRRLLAHELVHVGQQGWTKGKIQNRGVLIKRKKSPNLPLYQKNSSIVQKQAFGITRSIRSNIFGIQFRKRYY